MTKIAQEYLWYKELSIIKWLQNDGFFFSLFYLFYQYSRFAIHPNARVSTEQTTASGFPILDHNCTTLVEQLDGPGWNFVRIKFLLHTVYCNTTETTIP